MPRLPVCLPLPMSYGVPHASWDHRLVSCSPSHPKTLTCSGSKEEALFRLKGHRAWEGARGSRGRAQVGPALVGEGTPLTPHPVSASNRGFTKSRN